MSLPFYHHGKFALLAGWMVISGLLTAPTGFAQELPVITAKYQIENGTRKGWLVVTVEIPEGCHIYALTQKGSPPPTKLKLAESKMYTVIEEFRADKRPHVVEFDPVFEQRIETYEEGKVNLLAPIQVADGTDLKKLKVDLKFHGQVCSNTGCKPLFNQPVEVKFGGFYDPPADDDPAATLPRNDQRK
jgi:hypothetical protein